MNIETIVFLACVASAAVFARLAYQRRMDVLHGPYIEGRVSSSRDWMLAPFLWTTPSLEGQPQYVSDVDRRLPSGSREWT
jgi:hypothetical protein